MTASIWSNNSDITLNCWRITCFSFLLTATIFDLICFCRTSSSAFLLLLNFLFTRSYFISSRIEIFHIIFCKSIYRVEISTRVENLHIFGSLVNASKNVREFKCLWKGNTFFRLDLHISEKGGDIYLRKMTHFL